MRGRKLRTLKPLCNISVIPLEIFEFEVSCQQQIYLSKKIWSNNSFIMKNDNLPDSYWNYAVITDDKGIYDIEKVFGDIKINPSIYVLSNFPYEIIHRLHSLGYRNDYEDAWMIKVSTYKGNVNDAINVKLIENKEQFMQAYKCGRESADVNSPYEFSSYDLFLIDRQFEYTGREFDIKHYAAYMRDQIVGVATCITKGSISLICDVTTLRDYRNKGVGQTIMAEIEKDTVVKNTLYLVTERGAYTEQWYKKQGFETVFCGKCFTKI